MKRILKITLPPELGMPLLSATSYEKLVEGVQRVAEVTTSVHLTRRDIDCEGEAGKMGATTAKHQVTPTGVPTVAATAAVPEDRRQEPAERRDEGRREPVTAPRGRGPNGYSPFNQGQMTPEDRGRQNIRDRGRPISQNQFQRKQGSCQGCGGAHARSVCRFLQARCRSCNGIGHIAAVCRKLPMTKNYQRGAPPPPQHYRYPVFSKDPPTVAALPIPHFTQIPS